MLHKYTPTQNRCIWGISWLSLFSCIYALFELPRQHVVLAVVPGGVFLTSINFWRNPATLGWRKKIDMYYVKVGLLYNILYAYNCKYSIEYYLVTLIGVLFFQLSYYYYHYNYVWVSTLSHIMGHLLGNIGNIILYLALKT